MRHDLVNRWSSGGVVVQNLFNKILRRLTDSYLFGEGIAIHSDSLIGSLDIIGFEWWLADDERVDDNSEGPDIHLIRMALLSFENFRSDIVRGTTNGSFPFTIKLELGGKTEISYLDFHFVVEEEITELEISVDDSMRV